MTLLETTYTQLKSAGLVQSAEAFSSNYLNKNHNWYAYQKHTGRDYSVSAAIECLLSIRSQQCSNELTAAQLTALQQLEKQLAAYLYSKHCIVDVC